MRAQDVRDAARHLVQDDQHDERQEVEHVAPRHAERERGHEQDEEVAVGSQVQPAGGDHPAEADGVAAEQEGDASPRERRAFALGVVAIALVAVLVRLRFLDVPLSVDEGGYAAVARFWAGGSHLYRDVWVDRPQGLLLLYRGAFDLFGPHAWAVRLLATVWGAGLASVVALLVARVADRRTGLVAGLLVAMLSVGPRIEGFAANGELLAALPAAAALLAIRGLARPRGTTRCSSAPGALAAFALLVKQSGYDGGGAIGVWLLLAAWRGWLPRGAGAARARRWSPSARRSRSRLAVAHGAATGWRPLLVRGRRLPALRRERRDRLARRRAAPALVGLR